MGVANQKLNHTRHKAISTTQHQEKKESEDGSKTAASFFSSAFFFGAEDEGFKERDTDGPLDEGSSPLIRDPMAWGFDEEHASARFLGKLARVVGLDNFGLRVPRAPQNQQWTAEYRFGNRHPGQNNESSGSC